MNKKGDIWISAVLYFGLGIIIITLLLTAGLPVINKLRDKNIAIQTKEVFHTLDQNIREVLKGGPGTQRVVTLNIKKGIFKVNSNAVADSNTITWTFKDSKAYISEPNKKGTLLTSAVKVNDGNIEIVTNEGTTKGNYDITYTLRYDTADLPLAAINPAGLGVNAPVTISGIGDISIRNGGNFDPTGGDKRIILYLSGIGTA